MGSIVNSTYMSLDGDMINMANWHRDFFGEEARKAADDQLFGSDALIMGRHTYDGLFPSWSARSGTGEYADRMNCLPKYVVSSKLVDPAWTNTTVIGSNIVEQIGELKNRFDRNITQYGFGPLTRLMLDNDLLDEVRIWLHPVLSGAAQPTELLYRDANKHKLELVNTEVHTTGLIILVYWPARVSA